MKIYPLTTSQLTDLNAGELIDRYIKDMINQGIVITTDSEVQELHDVDSLLFKVGFGKPKF